MTATPDSEALDPQQIIAELQRELDESRAELAARNSAYSERIAYQAAANDVLKVMSASPGDPQPVFDLIVERARDLCSGYGATVYQFDGTLIHWRAATGVSDDPSVRQVVQALYPMGPTREWPAGRAIIERQVIHIRDLETEPGLTPAIRGLTVKSAVLVPLMRGGLPIGVLSLGSRKRGGFTGTQIELLKTFAEQAVIAITSAETYRELQQHTVDLQESLQFQTATSDVLSVISSSPNDLKPVIETIVQTARRLCQAEYALLLRRTADGIYRIAAQSNASKELSDWMEDNPVTAGDGSAVGIVASEKQTVHLKDSLTDPRFTDYLRQRVSKARSMLGVPLMQHDEVTGIIFLARTEVNPFTEKQIELVTNFADQAIIAISNVNLFDEVQAKTRDLSDALMYQTGSANILKVIASSPTDVGPVLQAIAESACELCEAVDASVFLRDGNHLTFSGHHGPLLIPDGRMPINRGWVAGRSFIDQKPVHVEDLQSDDGEFPEGRQLAEKHGHRTTLGVPLLRENVGIGAIVVRRMEVRPFTVEQIDLIGSFADQAVIAIGNVHLFEQVQERTRELANSLAELRAAQDRLVQTEKLASLGQLTAGIAHEIKNPLNFVNNFAGLSAELTDELNDVLKSAAFGEKIREEVDELTKMLKENLEKVVQHGKRADSIVKNMLLHSREGSGELRSADINSLVEESLNLAYHGARAEKSGFNITLKCDFDPDAGAAEVYPQEVTRALLNLISNGFYAATKHMSEADDETFEPVLTATTRNLGNNVEIRIRDNGTGIPTEVKDKIFNPFFTTKPAGEGTGLGLSMSHDIIVKQHGGTIEVDTALGAFTEFRIVLPRAGHP